MPRLPRLPLSAVFKPRRPAPIPPILEKSRSSRMEAIFEQGRLSQEMAALDDEPFEQIAHFKKGYKQIFLPKFTVSLVKSPSLTPIFAKFRVPLWFSKLDLRDFLFHCYNVRAFNIRSNVVQRPIEQYENYKGRTRKRWHRKQALKFMIIEMDKPFIWPEPEKDWDEAGFSKSLLDDRHKDEDLLMKVDGRKVPWVEGSDIMPDPWNGLDKASKQPLVGNPSVKEIREALAAEAEKLKSGRIKWQPTWKTVQGLSPTLPSRDGKRSQEQGEG